LAAALKAKQQSKEEEEEESTKPAKSCDVDILLWTLTSYLS
jgi:hypothetical protein